MLRPPEPGDAGVPDAMPEPDAMPDAAPVSRLPIYRRARHVAVYFAADGEADLSGLYAAALRRGIAFR